MAQISDSSASNLFLTTERTSLLKASIADAISSVDFLESCEKRTLPPFLFTRLAKLGVFGLTSSNKCRLTFQEVIDISGFLASFDLSLSIAVSVHNILGAPAFRDHYHHIDRLKVLEQISVGQHLVSYAITEPTSGSNPKQMLSHLSKVEDGFVLNGNKIWTGMGAWSDSIVVFAKDEKGSITALNIETDKQGVFPLAEHNTLGLRSVIQNPTTFENVAVSKSNILGSYGNGWQIANERMVEGRIAIAAMSLAGAKRCLLICWNYCSQRKIRNSTLSTLIYIREKLSGHINRIELLEYVLKVTTRDWEKHDHEFRGVLASSLKMVATEKSHEAIDDALQFMGGAGYDESNTVARYYRDHRSFRILEGPSETLSHFIAKFTALNPEYVFATIAELPQSRKDKYTHFIRNTISARNTSKQTADCTYTRMGYFLSLLYIHMATTRSNGHDALVNSSHSMLDECASKMRIYMPECAEDTSYLDDWFIDLQSQFLKTKKVNT